MKNIFNIIITNHVVTEHDVLSIQNINTKFIVYFFLIVSFIGNDKPV